MLALNAPDVLEGVFAIGVRRIIAALAAPATNAAAAYFQIAAIKGTTPNPIGRPAYQKPGIKRIQ